MIEAGIQACSLQYNPEIKDYFRSKHGVYMLHTHISYQSVLATILGH